MEKNELFDVSKNGKTKIYIHCAKNGNNNIIGNQDNQESWIDV